MRHQRKTILRANYGRLERSKIPNPLPHIDANWCWCDPIVELNEDGDEIVIHKEIMWN
jgi:hypothetical protein